MWIARVLGARLSTRVRGERGSATRGAVRESPAPPVLDNDWISAVWTCGYQVRHRRVLHCLSSTQEIPPFSERRRGTLLSISRSIYVCGGLSFATTGSPLALAPRAFSAARVSAAATADGRFGGGRGGGIDSRLVRGLRGLRGLSVAPLLPFFAFLHGFPLRRRHLHHFFERFSGILLARFFYKLQPRRHSILYG